MAKLDGKLDGRLDGKVAFITGAARGQGRAHAIRLAQDGADIIALDICAQIETASYPLATPDDLARTVKEVEDLGRRGVGFEADVRDVAAVRKAFDDGAAALGPVGVVVANAAIAPMTVDPADPDQEWSDVLDVNVTGVYNTVRVAIPSMIEAGNGGSIVLISSVAGITGSGGNSPGMLAYTASKHAVVGLMRAWANYLAPHNIRVNSVAPTGVRTPMVLNPAFPKYMEAHPEFAELLGNALPVEVVEPVDIANAVAWLASDEARYVTGTVLPVDAGAVNNR
jgi:SDR family mycofactocin-dependent oxidoreductase